MSSKFYQEQRLHQINWRNAQKFTSEWGHQNKGNYEHVLPKNNWDNTLYPNIKAELKKYLKDNRIQKHSGTHNLLSSWVLCVNLYFLTRLNNNFKDLLLNFFRGKISSDIQSIEEIGLEFSFESTSLLHTSKLLGESGGKRGSGQTSPDIAFLVNTSQGKGIILTECKFIEHSFYPCSARRTDDNTERLGNPDPERCMQSAKDYDYKAICHQHEWKRKYWDNLQLTDYAKDTLKRCPAATAGYQLFRQHSLACGIKNNSDYDLVASCVAFDERNTDLKNCLRRTGISNFQNDWGKLFEGDVIFAPWTHQEWVEYVRVNQLNHEFDDWLKYVNERYGY